jgi:hypothetical protein
MVKVVLQIRKPEKFNTYRNEIMNDLKIMKILAAENKEGNRRGRRSSDLRSGKGLKLN